MTAWITAFADEEKFRFWDQETGRPTRSHFANAVQVWCVAQDRTNVTIDEAAAAFNISPDLVREAVNSHGWMGCSDDGVIWHEGE